MQPGTDAGAAGRPGACRAGRPVQYSLTSTRTAATSIESPAAIASGKLIVAIKLYRELTGMGLKEAKLAVEALQRNGPR